MAGWVIDIDEDARVLTVSTRGEVSSGDLEQLHVAMKKLSPEHANFAALVDLRHATQGSLTARSIRDLAQLRSVLDPSSKRAVVVRTLLGVGLVNMYSLWRGDRGGRFHPFRDIDEARAYVGLPPSSESRSKSGDR